MNIRRGEKAHRLTIKHLAGVAELDPEWHVHHQDNWKANNAPENLIYAPACFNPSCARRDPYTGEYMSIEDWVRRYGAPAPSSVEDTPDWVFAMSNHIESEHYVE